MQGLAVMRVVSILLSVVVCLPHAAPENNILGFTSPQQDVFVVLGGSFQLNCTVKLTSISPANYEDQPANFTTVTPEPPDSSLSVYNISMTKGRTPLPQAWVTYHEKEMTLQLDVENVTKEDKGIYRCSYDEAVVAMKWVTVGEPPHKPTNITCVSYSFLNMTCFVTLSEHTGSIPYNWYLEYKTNRLQNSTLCKAVPGQSNVVSCPLRKDHFRIYELYTVTAIGTPDQTLYDTNVSATFDVELDFNIVKPGPVEGLHSEVLGSGSAQVTWKYPKDMSPTNPYTILEYEMVVTAEKGWDTKTQKFKHITGVMEESVTLDGLVCDARYEVAVRSRPETAVGAIYWSSWSNITFRTLQDRPAQSTHMTDGSFFVINRQEKDKYGLVLYWKNPSQRYDCGNITGYALESTPVDSNLKSVTLEASEMSTIGYTVVSEPEPSGWNKTITGYRVYQPLDSRFRTTEEHMFNMYTVNNVGQSLVASKMVIPNLEHAGHARVSWVSVEMSGGRPLVRWEVDAQHCHLVTDITYYWCSPNTDRSLNISYIRCKDDFDWLQVPVDNACNTSQHWINNTVVDMSGMRFAVSVGMTGLSGGMVWEKFRYKTYGAVPAEPHYRVSPDPGNHTRLQLAVLFNDYYEVEEGGRPDGLEVVYTASDKMKDCKHVSGNGHVTKTSSPVNYSNPAVTIEGLQPDTSYSVCVRFTNTFGAGGFGKLLQVKTSAPETSEIWTTIGAVCGAVGIGLFLIAVSFAIWRCRRRVSRLTKITNVDIEIQETDSYITAHTEFNMMTEMDEQKPSGHDSGKGSDSPSSSCSLSQNGSEGYEDIHEPDVKESTPILARRARRLSSASVTSRLSGYLKVDKYEQTLSVEDLLPCCSDDEEEGESNASFSPANGSPRQSYSRKPKIKPEITLDDFGVNNSQGSGCEFEIDQDDVECITGDVKKTQEYEKSENVKVAIYVADSTKPVVGDVNQPSSHDSGLATLRPGLVENDTDKIITDTKVGKSLETETTSEYSTATVEDNRVDNGSEKLVDDKPSVHSAVSSDITNQVIPPQASSICNNENFSSTEDKFDCSTNIKVDNDEVSKDKTAEDASQESADTDNSVLLSSIVPKFETFEQADTCQGQSDTENDMFSEQFDDKMGSFGFDMYQNPDLISLGQGSILSFATDTSNEDSRSILSYTSSEMANRTKQTHTPEPESSVLKMCNEISSEFTRTDMSGDELDEIKKEPSNGMQGEEHVLDTNKQEADIGKGILGEESNNGVNDRDKVVKSVNDKLDSGTNGEVNSYVKAAVNKG